MSHWFFFIFSISDSEKVENNIPLTNFNHYAINSCPPCYNMFILIFITEMSKLSTYFHPNNGIKSEYIPSVLGYTSTNHCSIIKYLIYGTEEIIQKVGEECHACDWNVFIPENPIMTPE